MNDTSPTPPHPTDFGTKKREVVGNKVPSKPLRKFMDEEGCDPKTVALALHVDPGTVRNWLRENEMPGIALVALEGIKRRKRQEAAQTATFLVVVPPDKLEAFGHVISAVGLNPVKLGV